MTLGGITPPTPYRALPGVGWYATRETFFRSGPTATRNRFFDEATGKVKPAKRHCPPSRYYNCCEERRLRTALCRPDSTDLALKRAPPAVAWICILHHAGSRVKPMAQRNLG